jgi:hypothetical protein
MYIMTTKRGQKKLSNKSKKCSKTVVKENVLGAERSTHPSLWYEPHHVLLPGMVSYLLLV